MCFSRFWLISNLVSVWIIVSPVTKHGSPAFQSIIDYMILNKYIDPSGWWQGRLRGKQGLLPGNYVQKLWWRHPKGRKTIISITNKNLMSPKNDMTRWGQEEEREIIDPSSFFSFILFFKYLIRYCNIPEGRWRFKNTISYLKKFIIFHETRFYLLKKTIKINKIYIQILLKKYKNKNKSKESNEYHLIMCLLINVVIVYFWFFLAIVISSLPFSFLWLSNISASLMLCCCLLHDTTLHTHTNNQHSRHLITQQIPFLISDFPLRKFVSNPMGGKTVSAAAAAAAQKDIYLYTLSLVQRTRNEREKKLVLEGDRLTTTK